MVSVILICGEITIYRSKAEMDISVENYEGVTSILNDKTENFIAFQN